MAGMTFRCHLPREVKTSGDGMWQIYYSGSSRGSNRLNWRSARQQERGIAAELRLQPSKAHPHLALGAVGWW